MFCLYASFNFEFWFMHFISIFHKNGKNTENIELKLCQKLTIRYWMGTLCFVRNNNPKLKDTWRRSQVYRNGFKIGNFELNWNIWSKIVILFSYNSVHFQFKPFVKQYYFSSVVLIETDKNTFIATKFSHMTFKNCFERSASAFICLRISDAKLSSFFFTWSLPLFDVFSAPTSRNYVLHHHRYHKVIHHCIVFKVFLWRKIIWQ